MIEFLEIRDVVQATGLSRSGVRLAVSAGRLTATARTRRGALLFTPEAVIDFARVRGRVCTRREE